MLQHFWMAPATCQCSLHLWGNTQSCNTWQYNKIENKRSLRCQNSCTKYLWVSSSNSTLPQCIYASRKHKRWDNPTWLPAHKTDAWLYKPILCASKYGTRMYSTMASGAMSSFEVQQRIYLQLPSYYFFTPLVQRKWEIPHSLVKAVWDSQDSPFFSMVNNSTNYVGAQKYAHIVFHTLILPLIRRRHYKPRWETFDNPSTISKYINFFVSWYTSTLDARWVVCSRVFSIELSLVQRLHKSSLGVIVIRCIWEDTTSTNLTYPRHSPIVF